MMGDLHIESSVCISRRAVPEEPSKPFQKGQISASCAPHWRRPTGSLIACVSIGRCCSDYRPFFAVIKALLLLLLLLLLPYWALALIPCQKDKSDASQLSFSPATCSCTAGCSGCSSDLALLLWSRMPRPARTKGDTRRVRLAEHAGLAGRAL
jgi:hypothetical protein